MKTQIKINLALAANASLALALGTWIDPQITWRECIGVHIGIWAALTGNCVVFTLIEHTTTHEKDHPIPNP